MRTSQVNNLQAGSLMLTGLPIYTRRSAFGNLDIVALGGANMQRTRVADGGHNERQCKSALIGRGCRLLGDISERLCLSVPAPLQSWRFGWFTRRA